MLCSIVGFIFANDILLLQRLPLPTSLMMLIAIATYLQIQIFKVIFYVPTYAFFHLHIIMFPSLPISSVYLPEWLWSQSGCQLFWTTWVMYGEHFNVFGLKTSPNTLTYDLSIPKCNCTYLPIHLTTMFHTSSYLLSRTFPFIYFPYI